MSHSSPAPSPAVPWWRVGPMWLVVGGPLVVVVASIVTAVIAVRHADPVLERAEVRRTLQPAQSLEGPDRAAALIKLQPAHQARNHAASPVVPEAER